MQKAFWLLAASLGAQAAHAVDKPVIAPPPAWVKPVAVPAAPAKPDEAAVHILLSDQQVSLEPGKRIIYSHSALKVQTSQGLGVGNISLPWNPETDILTVHKLVIRRGDTLIDILASGQTFTVARREQNMEIATLDGVLTANIQPEGLEVGDILETEFSIETSDPVLRGHVEQAGAAWNTLPVQQAHFSARWPSTMKVATRATTGLPALKPVKQGALTTLDLSVANLEPLPTPNGAPLRYRIGRLVEISDFGSWADAAALEAPLYAKASVIPAKGPLRDELEKIKAASTDPKARTEAALALVQQRVRYVALLMGIGGLTPADAETSWSRRYGDCKAKTVMLLGLLHELGIQADPVTVSTIYGDGMDQRLPMIALFNHVLVRAQIAGKTYWLDGTRTGDNNLDRIETPYFGWGLPLVPTGATLVRIMPGPLDTPTETASIEIDARQGISLPAPAKATIVLRGDAALSASLGLANLAGDARDRALREYWRGRFDVLEPKTVTASYDAKTGEETLSLEGTAKMDWSKGRYETDGTAIGYRADFTRQPGPDTDAPWLVAFPYYAKLTERVLLPKGFTAGKTQAKDDVNLTVAGVAYLRTTRAADDVVTVERSERSLVPDFPAKDAPAAQKTLRDLADQAIYIQRPNAYRPTDAEVDELLKKPPETADAYFSRAILLAGRKRETEALVALDQAIALEPGNIKALTVRAQYRLSQNQPDLAEKDVAAAVTSDPKDPMTLHIQAIYMAARGNWKEAEPLLTALLKTNPGDSQALGVRAEANRALGKPDAAFADATAALAAGLEGPELRLIRANYFKANGQEADALAEASKLEALGGSNSYSVVVAARIYAAYDKKPEAMRAFDKALQMKPEPFIYVNRSMIRLRTDTAGRTADLDAALKLDPHSSQALVARGDLARDQKDYRAALAYYDTALNQHPEQDDARIARGIAYAKLGDTARAREDLSRARAALKVPMALNDMCFSLAKAGVELEAALADCDAALAGAPDSPSIMDSRAFVLLRLDRVDEAITMYDRALAKQPKLSESLYGRGVAWARKGDKTRSEADIAAALKVSPGMGDEFMSYGITPDASAARQVAAAK